MNIVNTINEIFPLTWPRVLLYVVLAVVFSLVLFPDPWFLGVGIAIGAGILIEVSIWLVRRLCVNGARLTRDCAGHLRSGPSEDAR